MIRTLNQIIVILTITDHGTNPTRGRDAEKARVKWIPHRDLIPKIYGATFTSDLVTRPIGALKTPTALVAQLLIATAHAARLAIDLAIPPTPVSLPLFAFLQKERVKASDRATKGGSRARISYSGQRSFLRPTSCGPSTRLYRAQRLQWWRRWVHLRIHWPYYIRNHHQYREIQHLCSQPYCCAFSRNPGALRLYI